MSDFLVNPRHFKNVSTVCEQKKAQKQNVSRILFTSGSLFEEGGGVCKENC